jgi:hypothetical protein
MDSAGSLGAVEFVSSSRISAIDGVGERLCLPKTVGEREIFTQFCLLWHFERAVGLPFMEDGFPVCIGDGSHWKGLPLLLLVEETRVDVGECCQEGMLWLT